jgi:hypothetical protein
MYTNERNIFEKWVRNDPLQLNSSEAICSYFLMTLLSLLIFLYFTMLYLSRPLQPNLEKVIPAIPAHFIMAIGLQNPMQGGIRPKSCDV